MNCSVGVWLQPKRTKRWETKSRRKFHVFCWKKIEDKTARYLFESNNRRYIHTHIDLMCFRLNVFMHDFRSFLLCLNLFNRLHFSIRISNTLCLLDIRLLLGIFFFRFYFVRGGKRKWHLIHSKHAFQCRIDRTMILSQESCWIEKKEKS